MLVYNATTKRVEVLVELDGGAGGGKVEILNYFQAEQPVSPQNNETWYDTTNNLIKTYKTDQWDQGKQPAVGTFYLFNGKYYTYNGTTLVESDLSIYQLKSNISQDYTETSQEKYPSSKALSDAQKVNVKSVNSELPDANGNVVVSNVASADQLNSPDSINDYGDFIFRTSAGTKSISADPNTFLGQATLLSLQGNIENPRQSLNNVDTSHVEAPRVFVPIDTATFGTMVNHITGDYTFNFDGTDWTLQGETPTTVNLEDYGITLSATALSGDSFVVNYTYDNTGEEPTEYASATYTAVNRLTITVTESTFAGKVNNIIGSYNFIYNGNVWLINDTIANLTEYGITITGTAVSGDSITVVYNGDMKVATPTSFITSSFNQFNPANVLSGYTINENGEIVESAGSLVAYIHGVGGLQNAHGSRHGDYTIFDSNGTLSRIGWKKDAPTVGYVEVGQPTENPTGIFSGFSSSDYLQLEKSLGDISFNTLDIYTKITTPSSWQSSGNGVIIARSDWNAVGITMADDAKIRGRVRFIDDTYFDILTDLALATSITYYIHFKADSQNHTLLIEYSTDNVNWISKTAEIGEGNTIATGGYYRLGYGNFGAFQGSIDMNNTYIKINGVIWFNGRAADVPETVVLPQAGTDVELSSDSTSTTSWLTFTETGYICVALTNTAKLCVHPEWSGYNDNKYQEYIAPVTWANNTPVDGKRTKPSIINIPTTGYLEDDETHEQKDLPCANYLGKVGLVYDEILFKEHKYINRIGYLAYSQANLNTVIEMGVDYVYDNNGIYYVLQNPKTYIINYTIVDDNVVLDTNEEGEYMVCDFGTEEFMNTEVGLIGNFLYGNNLVDKLRTDVLTKSPQTLSPEQQRQIWKNIGTLPLYNYPKTVNAGTTSTVELEDEYTMYELVPNQDTTLVFDASNLTKTNDAWTTFYLFINMTDAQQAYEITWPTSIQWGNTSPTMTAMASYLFSFTKPKGSNVWIGNQMFSFINN